MGASWEFAFNDIFLSNHTDSMPTEAHVLKQKRKKLKNSQEIGLDAEEAIQRGDSDNTIRVLSTRHGIQKLCSRSTENFNPEKESQFEQTFNDFCDSSKRLRDNTPTEDFNTDKFNVDKFDAQVKSITEMVKHKQQELASYKREQEASYKREQEASIRHEGEASYRPEEETSARQHIIPDLESLRVSCKAHYSCGPVGIGLGPAIKLERGMKPKIELSVDFTLNNSSPNQKSGVEASLSAQKGRCEVSVESNLSKTGLEHGYTAQIHGFTNFSGGVQVRHKSFKQLLHPVTTRDNGRLFFGGTLKRGGAASNIRFPVLPFETLKEFVHFDVNESRLDSGSPYFKEQDQVDLPSKEIDDVELGQEESEANPPLNEIRSVGNQEETTEEQEETTEKQEETIKHEESGEREVPVARRDRRQDYQFEMRAPEPPPVQQSSVYPTPLSCFYGCLLSVVACLSLLYVVDIFQFLEKLKYRIKYIIESQ